MAIRTSDLDRPTMGWQSKPTPAILSILLLSAAGYITQIISAATGWHDFRNLLALQNAGDFRWFQLFSSLLLYSAEPQELWRLIANFILLWSFGNEVERALGTGRFLVLFFLAGAVGGICSIGISGSAFYPRMGADVATLSIVTAFATLYPKLRTCQFIHTVELPWNATTVAIATVLLFQSVKMIVHRSFETGSDLIGVLVGFLFVRIFMHAEPLVFSSRTPRVPRKSREKKPEEKIRASKRKATAASDPKKSQFIRSKVDPILEKIARDGITSLTPEERKILEKARKIMDKNP